MHSFREFSLQLYYSFYFHNLRMKPTNTRNNPYLSETCFSHLTVFYTFPVAPVCEKLQHLPYPNLPLWYKRCLELIQLRRIRYEKNTLLCSPKAQQKFINVPLCIPQQRKGKLGHLTQYSQSVADVTETSTKKWCHVAFVHLVSKILALPHHWPQDWGLLCLTTSLQTLFFIEDYYINQS